jgi:hypothetical protein
VCFEEIVRWLRCDGVCGREPSPVVLGGEWEGTWEVWGDGSYKAYLGAVRSCGSLGLSCRTGRDELRQNGTR